MWVKFFNTHQFSDLSQWRALTVPQLRCDLLVPMLTITIHMAPQILALTTLAPLSHPSQAKSKISH